MNDRQLRYILTIAEEKNLTAAAKKLYISQPSLSNLLEHVEAELNVKLFQRTPTGMILTDAGHLYAESAKQILGLLRSLDFKLDETRKFQHGSMSIGCSHQLSPFIFPKVVPAIRKQFPHYTLQLYEDRMRSLQEKLLSGELDIVFLYSETPLKRIKNIPFSSERLHLLTPSWFDSNAIHNIDGFDTLTDFSVLKNQPFALFKTGHYLRKYSDLIFTENNFEPSIVLETDNWQTCITMVESGEAFTLLPYSPLTENVSADSTNSHLRKIMLPGDYQRNLCICFREELEDHAVVQAFIQISRTTASYYSTE
ncbi:DNA-binding transcriptional LysR family regulator [Lachnospiraceae bacterium PM6-15]|uniref:LysR family transcriptional regulator n=1 Tax=Ohessyouella blattaphilus TaxID=2949333 RepID=UPI003E2FA5ED